MRILIHSNGPHVPSGYGRQTALLIPQLLEQGHEVAVSTFYGVSGSALQWHGVELMPAGQADFGVDVLPGHALRFKADLILTLMDFYKLYPISEALREWRVAAWLPVDCHPLGEPDDLTLRNSAAHAIAMSRFGHEQLLASGHAAPYVPHAVDAGMFKPLAPSDRDDMRTALGIADRFVIGMCAANNDSMRKGFPEQFEAFARFREKHPEALLLLHSLAASRAGYNLMALAEKKGIADAVKLSDQYAQISGEVGDDTMSDWYNVLDVYSGCSYAEAFGVPILEAQACGTPVVVTAGSAMKEMRGSGWLVSGQEFWNPVHSANWVRPDVADIVRGYERAHAAWNVQSWRERARKFALDYDIETVGKAHWAPALEMISSR